ncbi:hypothetical protein GCM10023147_40070 [Tsukamurella soli]|uniref:4-amino-4-deoxy-L-arabinose transferase n=1 Tax=Tsukamurella soli TaxID=644556 RepID=A0ABP8K643_9ACTN
MLAAVLIAAQLILRAYVLARGNFYWDDVAFIGRASGPLPDARLWWADYDGHLMPGALLTAGLLTALAPLSWPVAAASLLVLQAVASLAMLRALVVLAGRRLLVLVPFAFYLFSPLTVPAFAWWAAGLNALPMQIGLAVAVAETVRFVRTRSRLAFGLSLAGYVGGLLFFEKALVVPFVAFAAVAVGRAVRARERPVRSTLRRGAPLWGAYAAITALWLVLYAATAHPRPGDHTVWFTGHALSRSLHSVLAPAALGGPWTWYRVNPGPPIVVPSLVVTVIGALAVCGVLVVTAWRSPRALWAWGAAAAYFVVSLAPVYWLRSSALSSLLLPLSLRYFPDFAAVLALAGGLVATARVVPPAQRVRRVRPALAAERFAAPLAVAVTVGFVVSGSVSTVRFAHIWHANPTATYLANLRAGARVYAGTTVLDDEVDGRIMSKLAYPDNRLSAVLDRVRPRPDFEEYAPEPILVDPSGRFLPGRVTRVRSVQPGPIAGCGFRVDEYRPTVLSYEGRLNFWDWVVQLNYLASGAGRISITQDGIGQTVTVPVQRGPHTLYVRVAGAGYGLRAQAITPGLIVCVSGGPVGLLVPR